MGQLRVGMVGYAFMGAAHSQAWRTVNRAFDLPLSAELSVVSGRSEEGVAAAVRAAQARSIRFRSGVTFSGTHNATE